MTLKTSSKARVRQSGLVGVSRPDVNNHTRLDTSEQYMISREESLEQISNYSFVRTLDSQQHRLDASANSQLYLRPAKKTEKERNYSLCSRCINPQNAEIERIQTFQDTIATMIYPGSASPVPRYLKLGLESLLCGCLQVECDLACLLAVAKEDDLDSQIIARRRVSTRRPSSRLGVKKGDLPISS